MTGWGRGFISRDGREMTLEMKSVNHRFLDIAFRVPRNLSFLEEAVRGWLKDSGMMRGHIEVVINYSNTREDARKISIDTHRLRLMRDAMASEPELFASLCQPTSAELMTLCEAVTITEAQEENDIILAIAKECFDTAAAVMLEMRHREGSNLSRDLLEKLSAFSCLRDGIAQKAPEVPAAYKQRLEARLAELGAAADPVRVAQEVAIMADHCAIDEELSRLSSHIEQFRNAVLHNEEAGKRLDFLLQEMNRETNTIGSKASDLTISQAVVDCKCILEKLREQVQNIV